MADLPRQDKPVPQAANPAEDPVAALAPEAIFDAYFASVKGRDELWVVHWAVHDTYAREGNPMLQQALARILHDVTQNRRPDRERYSERHQPKASPVIPNEFPLASEEHLAIRDALMALRFAETTHITEPVAIEVGLQNHHYRYQSALLPDTEVVLSEVGGTSVYLSVVPLSPSDS